MTARILVVDDEPDLEALIQQKFRHQIRDGAISFLFARDGVEALTMLKTNPDIDLVVTDINMPRMDGFEVLARLRDDVVTAALPVTVVTSQILVPEQYQALVHAKGVVLKHELSPAVWQRVFLDAGLGALEPATSETIKPT